MTMCSSPGSSVVSRPTITFEKKSCAGAKKYDSGSATSSTARVAIARAQSSASATVPSTHISPRR